MLPVVPGAAVAGRYVLGDPSGESRGDCLDAVPVPGGLGVFVGDVVGIDGPAELAAERLRAVLSERLGSGVGLAEAMTDLDLYAASTPQLVAATMCAGIVNVADGEFEWCAAGHPPPLRWGALNPPAFLPGPVGPPLGTGRATTRTTRRVHLAEGDMVALYSDGLVAFDGRSLDDGQRLLVDGAARAVARGGSEVPVQFGDEICERVFQEIASGAHHDDATMLLAIRTGDTLPFALEVPADPVQLRVLRHAINAWLDSLGASLADHVGLGHAAVELAANVISHAYLDQPAADRVIRCDAVLQGDGWVHISVTDRGRWRSQDSTGQGLMMAAGLADRLDIERSSNGTSVTVSQRLWRPVAVLQPLRDGASPVVEVPNELTVDASPGRLTATGPVDDISVDVFHAALTRATRSGTQDCVVDLSRVTHLASPGVQALFEFVGRSERVGAALTIQATPGSPAAQILELVGLRAVDPRA